MTIWDVALAYSRRMRAEEFFSHRTAAQLWGMPLPSRCSELMPIETSVIEGQTNPARAAGTLGHRLRECEVHELGWIRVASAAETWLQMASALNETELVMAGDYMLAKQCSASNPLLRGGQPLTSRDQLAALVGQRRRCRGSARAKRAQFQVREHVRSPMETRLRLLVLAAGFPEPELNHAVITRAGPRFVIDLAYPERMVGIEYDGAEFHFAAPAVERDILRHEILRHEGWRMLRVTKMQLHNPERLIDRLRSALDSRGFAAQRSP